MKYLTAFSLLLALIGPALAQELYLRDVPDGHYAYDAVYDLIKRGVTGGYPDGTFRGKKMMSRYEIAAFISKLAKSFKLDQGADEKLVAELKTETAALKYQVDKDKKERRVGGELQARWRGGVTPEARGAQAEYRLKVSWERNFADLAGLKVNLDTMDSGGGGASRDLVRELLDFEGRVKLGSSIIKVTAGPGDVIHFDNGLFPGENGLRYRRPRRTASLTNTLGNTEFSLEHLTRSTDASGAIGIEELSLRICQRFPGLKLTLNPRSFAAAAGGQRDNRLELSGEIGPVAAWRSTLLIGLAKTGEYPHGLLVRGELAYADWFKLLAQKVGSQYRETFSYGIFDLFDRNLADGTTNYGLELSNPFSDGWLARVKYDFTAPGDKVTTEWHLGRRLDAAASLELVYQTYRAGGSSQALGLMTSLTF